MTARYFYVSAIDGSKRYLIAGPWGTHDDALARVDPVRRHASNLNGRAWFMAWGTAGSTDECPTPLGRFGDAEEQTP